ncbi:MULTISPECIES: hypothetical protein [unclassified Variovorax]|uniref:hypothetical protein n=1 Tax=unclassified Variovorax TaxID=663243 RepID=UPI001BD66F7D|nr:MULTISPECIES: hypothetical protein [unclassified Variovorax]
MRKAATGVAFRPVNKRRFLLITLGGGLLAAMRAVSALPGGVLTRAHRVIE